MVGLIKKQNTIPVMEYYSGLKKNKKARYSVVFN